LKHSGGGGAAGGAGLNLLTLHKPFKYPVFQALDSQTSTGVANSFDTTSVRKLPEKQCILQGNRI